MNTSRPQHSTLFQSTYKHLNDYQKLTLKNVAVKGLTIAHFANRDWFNHHNHEKAFSILITKRQYSIDEAFAELDQLDEYQAEGVLKGLTHDEVQGLNQEQINAMLECGLTNEIVKGLNNSHILAYLALKDQGLNPKDLCDKNWFTSEHTFPPCYI